MKVKDTANKRGSYDDLNQMKRQSSAKEPNKMEGIKENLRLRQELEEMRKEIAFLKKAAAFLGMKIG